LRAKNMTEFNGKEAFNQRLPLYAYLEPLMTGRRVLELGCGSGAGADHLAAHGAARVVAVDTDPAIVAGAGVRYSRPNLDFRTAPNLLDGVSGEPFDVVLVPEAEALLRRPEAIPALGRLLAGGGRLVLVTVSADRAAGGAATPGGPTGIGYYELSDALLPHFPAVQMFGVTPFAGFGVVEFDVEGDGLRVDTRLVESGAETPAAYVAVAGSEAVGGLGYALVQVPFAPIEAKLAAGAVAEDRGALARLQVAEQRLDEVERRARARVDEADGRAADLRRKLEDAGAQVESTMRVARAQGEEIEELRGRLRRASEDRALLDAEVGKLRHALAEADESVMSLTRRTAEEMSAVARRLSEGFRAPAARDGHEWEQAPAAGAAALEDVGRVRVALAEAEARASVAEQRLEEVGTVGRERQAALDDVLERLRQAEEATARERVFVARLQAQLLAAGGSARAQDELGTALGLRDERIALLEGEKQELVWRLAELEEKLRHTIGRAVVSDNSGRVKDDELDAARASRARAQEEFHRAAGAHVDEVTQLRAAVAEQTALVAELEEAARVAEASAAAATIEATTLRKNAKGLEEADRARRTRLAELEGKLLRLEHERKTAAAAAASAGAGGNAEAIVELGRRVAQVSGERDELRGNLERIMLGAVESEEALARARDEVAVGRARLSSLEAQVARLGQPGTPLRVRAVSHEGASAPRNGHEASALATARELQAIEAGLRAELESLTQVEEALKAELGAPAAAGGAERVGGRPDDDQGAEVILLNATLANYRRRASELRDELEGIRRRLDSLSPSEISGYLEELGEDLAEMELEK
jgi:SAM-dependent methyltransferase